MKVLNSNKRKRKIKKTWKKKRRNGVTNKNTGWLTINIDLSDAIELDVDWSFDKSRRIINSGKKEDG